MSMAKSKKKKASAAPTEADAAASDRGPLLLVICVAALTRLVHLAIYSANPMFRHPILDPRYYDEWGQRIAGGDWFGSNVFEMSPLYPYFLGTLYTIFGHSYVAVCLVQAILGTILCALIFRITMGLFGRGPALVAGLVAAVYPVFVYYDVMVMKTSLGVFLAVASLYFLMRGRSRWDEFFAGLMLGAAALVRDNYLAVVPFFAIWLLAKRQWGGRAQPAAAGALVVGVMTAILPVTFRNMAVSGDFVLTTSGGGEVFYIGNNDEATGLYKAPPFVRADPRFEHEDFRRKARELTGNDDLSHAEASRYWFGRGLDFIRENPGRTIGLYLKKFGLMWNRVEVADNYSFNFNRRLSPPLQVPIDYGMLAALGLVGVFLTRNQWRRLMPLYLMFIAYFAGLLPFFYFSRFRVPLTPILIIFASFALVRLWQAGRAGNWKIAGIIAGPAVALYLLTMVPLVPEADYRDFSNPYEKLGAAHLADTNYREALAAFQESARIDPNRDTIQFNLGLAHEKLGNITAAISAYENALRMRPENTAAQTRLTQLRDSASAGLREEVAAMRLEMNTEDQLSPAEIELEIGRFYAQKGFPPQAIERFQEALRIDPDLVMARLALAISFSQNGQDDVGLRIAEEFVRNNPGHVEGILVQTGCLMGLGRNAEAKRILDEIVASNPDVASLYLRLGQVERLLGNREAALQAFRRCIESDPGPPEAAAATRAIRELEAGG